MGTQKLGPSKQKTPQKVSKSHTDFYKRGNNHRQKDSIQLQKIEEIGVDFFQQVGEDDEDDFQQALQNIYKRYGGGPSLKSSTGLQQELQKKKELMGSYYSNPLLTKISTEKDREQFSQALQQNTTGGKGDSTVSAKNVQSRESAASVKAGSTNQN